jgi:hypothetical protein
MHDIKNDQLTVTLLDPNTDRERLGARYCAGGYIFQVTDSKLGPLMAGPTYPDDYNVFDGQGIPDAFNLSPLRSVGEASECLIPGVGICDLDPNYQKNGVKSFSDWTVDIGPSDARMTTQQAYREWSLTLERVVTLMGRTVRSWIKLSNTGRAFIPMRWFPHPFYPHAGDELIKLNIDVRFGESAGYELRPNGWIARKNWPWAGGGHYQALDHNATERLVIQQRHPLLGTVSATCSYVPDFFPIWGNANTFSWEPFFERQIAPGQSLDWFIDYDF